MIWYLLGVAVVSLILGYILGVAVDKRDAEKAIKERDEVIENLREDLVNCHVQIGEIKSHAEIAVKEFLENRRSNGDLFIDPRYDSPEQLW